VAIAGTFRQAEATRRVGMKVVLISLERGDKVWRRNQYRATKLVRQNLVSQLWFVDPVRRGPDPLDLTSAHSGILVVSPSPPVPNGWTASPTWPADSVVR
jgi:hypothetical protein